MAFSLKVFRIAKSRYADDLKGTGAFYTGGRWNNVGNFVLYTSSSISLCMLEVLVHVSPHTWPEDMCLVTIDIPAESIEQVKLEDLEEGWAKLPNSSLAQAIGDEWLLKSESLVLAVPSVINPKEVNYLINPHHPLFKKVVVEEIIPWKFDPRLGS